MSDGNSAAIAGAGTGADVWDEQDPFTLTQIANLSSTIRSADKVAQVSFQSFIGKLPRARSSAVELHGRLPNADDSVLVAVDPHSRGLEIVVGTNATHSVDDRACQLAALAMTSRFVVGDLINGIRDGIAVLADHAHPPTVLHTDLPENA